MVHKILGAEMNVCGWSTCYQSLSDHMNLQVEIKDGDFAGVIFKLFKLVFKLLNRVSRTPLFQNTNLRFNDVV